MLITHHNFIVDSVAVIKNGFQYGNINYPPLFRYKNSIFFYLTYFTTDSYYILKNLEVQNRQNLSDNLNKAKTQNTFDRLE